MGIGRSLPAHIASQAAATYVRQAWHEPIGDPDGDKGQ